MPELKKECIEGYLRHLLGKPVTVLGLLRLGEAPEERSIKEYGYGTPVQVDYLIAGDRYRSVIHTLNAGPFGHEHMADRAQVLLWEHRAFNQLQQHVRSLDVGGFVGNGNLLSLGGVDELFLLTEYVEGNGYFLDLARLQDRGELTDLDLARTDALCNYLVQIHKVKGPDPGLYIRRIRELVGHGECIMGLTDSYPADYPFPSAQMLEEIEHRCLKWRWRLKRCTHRLRQIHGDFHPWNILFQAGTDFRVLDRSRGEYGDPADDVASLTMNYIFSSLQRSGRLEGAFAALFDRFWKTYLEQSGDREMLDVIAPFFVFRGLVMASPVWYPTLAMSVRKALFAFMHSVLESATFDPARVNEYCGV
jgi:streptomycin 6-kinase